MSKQANAMDSFEREEQIRQRAYRLWEESGRPEGAAEEHWDRATQDLDREHAELDRAGEAPSIKTAPAPGSEQPAADRI